MENTGFIIISSDEGVHKEPSYQQDLICYGTFEPSEITVQRIPNQQTNYILMPYAKSPKTKGYYDIIVYADGCVEIKELIEWKFSMTCQGEWTAELSGGDTSNESWLKNPQYLLTLPSDLPNPLISTTILLTQAKAPIDLIPYQIIPYQFYIGFYILEAGHVESIVAHCKTWKNAQETYLHFQADTSKDNQFIIIPATHFPGQLTSFRLTVFSDTPVSLVKRE